MAAATRPIAFPPERTGWFEEARFGLFIHWGLYSLLGRGEWVMNREQISAVEYERLADRFTAEGYEPAEWAALAKRAGMRYAVLTSRHHEGFSLWDSTVNPFNAARSAVGRDLVAEYVEAFRGAGLKVGLYHSLGDWHHPDWARGFKGDAAARERYMAYNRELVLELVTGYGPIDVLWYDLPTNYTAQEWGSVELNAEVRALQPQIVINHRAGTTEDFATRERTLAGAPRGRMWESCMTLNENWGYTERDHQWKSPRDVVIMLADVAGGGGNLLLNVGPDGAGRIPDESVRILERVGRWMEVHGESIYASERPERFSWNPWGASTARGTDLYLHLRTYFGERLVVGCLRNEVRRASLLTTGRDLDVEQGGNRTVITGLPDESPDELMSVVKLELDTPPVQDYRPVSGEIDVYPDLPP